MNAYAVLFCVACGLALALVEVVAVFIVVVREHRRVLKSLTKEQRERLKRGETLWEKE